MASYVKGIDALWRAYNKAVKEGSTIKMHDLKVKIADAYGSTYEAQGDVKSLIYRTLRPRVKEMDRLYAEADKHKVSDPEYSDKLAEKGDRLNEQLEAMRDMAAAFGYRFRMEENKEGDSTIIRWE